MKTFTKALLLLMIFSGGLLLALNVGAVQDPMESHSYVRINDPRTPTPVWGPAVAASAAAAVSISGGSVSLANANVAVTNVVNVHEVGSPTPTLNPTQMPQMIATLQAQNASLSNDVKALSTSVANAQSTMIAQANLGLTPKPSPVLGAGIQFTVTPVVQSFLMNEATPDYTKAANASLQLTQVAMVNLQLTPWPSPIPGGGFYFTATPQIIVSNPPTPDMTKLANAPLQLTQIARQLTGNISLGNIETNVASSATFDLDIWNQMGGSYVPGTYTPVPNQLRNVADNTLNASNRSTTMDTNLQAVATQVAGLNAKATTMNTGAVAVVSQPTPNLTQVPSAAQANAQLTPIFNSSNRATTMDTNLQAVATTVAALNAKGTTFNTGAVAFAATPNVNAYVVGGVPQAQAALTMIPTPVGQGTPVVPAASGSGQQFCWPWVPRDNFFSYSASVSTTTPVTIGTPGANMFWDLFPSVITNTSASSVAFTIKKGTTVLWSDTVAAGDRAYIPLLTAGGTAAQPYILTLGSAVTSLLWNGQYAVNYR